MLLHIKMLVHLRFALPPWWAKDATGTHCAYQQRDGHWSV